MARIAGVNIPTDKRVVIALTAIYGIGRTMAEKICAASKVEVSRRVKELGDDELMRLRDEIDKNYMVEGDRRREAAMNIKHLLDLGCYRGVRHRRNLPVRGQRTHTNARTRRGPARPIAGKKQAAK